MEAAETANPARMQSTVVFAGRKVHVEPSDAKAAKPFYLANN
jgi:hypothetical protein